MSLSCLILFCPPLAHSSTSFIIFSFPNLHTYTLLIGTYLPGNTRSHLFHSLLTSDPVIHFMHIISIHQVFKVNFGHLLTTPSSWLIFPSIILGLPSSHGTPSNPVQSISFQSFRIHFQFALQWSRICSTVRFDVFHSLIQCTILFQFVHFPSQSSPICVTIKFSFL